MGKFKKSILYNHELYFGSYNKNVFLIDLKTGLNIDGETEKNIVYKMTGEEYGWNIYESGKTMYRRKTAKGAK